MRNIIAVVLLGFSLSACSNNPAGPSPPPNNAPIFTTSGNGNTVFTVPAYVTRARIVGSYSGNSSNFIVWIGNAGAGCSVTGGASCRLIVNELIGTAWATTTYDATVQTGGGGEAAISHSTGVAWTFTEVR